MTNRQAKWLLPLGFGVLSGACGGASSQQNAELVSLRSRVDALERRVAMLSPQAEPRQAVTGVVLDTDGMPSSAADIAVVVGDIKTEGLTDDAGRFSVDVPFEAAAF